MIEISLEFREMEGGAMSMTVTPHGIETSTPNEQLVARPLFEALKLYMTMLQSAAGQGATLEKVGLSDQEIENFRNAFIKSRHGPINPQSDS